MIAHIGCEKHCKKRITISERDCCVFSSFDFSDAIAQSRNLYGLRRRQYFDVPPISIGEPFFSCLHEKPSPPGGRQGHVVKHGIGTGEYRYGNLPVSLVLDIDKERNWESRQLGITFISANIRLPTALYLCNNLISKINKGSRLCQKPWLQPRCLPEGRL